MAYYKGLSLIGTGDILHPFWRKEFIENISKEEFENDKGTYRINFNNQILFLLTTELSFIYKEKNKLRKNHLLLIFPDLKTVDKISEYLESKNFNLSSDGRPILKIDIKNFLKIIFEIDPKIIVIPAHIWTPWFSTLGSKSGFDFPEEAFGEYIKNIFAIETGLSTDPPMHWLCSFLDNFNLISNSDAHNPESLGRNATIFSGEKNLFDITFLDIYNALKYNDNNILNNNNNNNNKENKNFFIDNKFKLFGTINLFPQLGKYYYNGHRKCNISLSPEQSKKINDICPICHKQITKGVLGRIYELKDRDSGDKRRNKKFYKNIIPIEEIFMIIFNKILCKNKIKLLYYFFIENIEKELYLLTFYKKNDIQNLINKNNDKLKTFLEKISKNFNDINKLINIFYHDFAEFIEKINLKKIEIEPGFDGKYGDIKK